MSVDPENLAHIVWPALCCRCLITAKPETSKKKKKEGGSMKKGEAGQGMSREMGRRENVWMSY